MYLYLAYHHNWSGESDFRRHWQLNLTRTKGEEFGAVYEVVADNTGKWILRSETDTNVSLLSTYKNKVPLGEIDDDKLEQFEKVLEQTPLPKGEEDCQDWAKNVVDRLVEKRLAPGRALMFLAMVPSN